PQNGWAVMNDNERWFLAKTSDGGMTWYDFTPAVWERGDTPITPHLFAYNMTHVWVFFNQNMWLTSDGGQSWNSIPIAFVDFYVQFSFLDPTHAFAITDCCTLYRSDDGGLTWQLIATIPGLDQPLSLEFENATDGWLTGRDKDDSMVIFRTSDGG